MEGFIDRLAELLKTLFGSEHSDRDEDAARSAGRAGAGGTADTSSHPRSSDPDFNEAWEELDEYMRTGSNSTRSSRESRGGAGRGAGQSRRPDESLRQDYANLEVPFGADIDVVRSSYKRLMMKYHPDKYARNPEKQKMALEISKKINESFERIRSSHESAG